MHLIDSIEIHYFRSIYKITLKKINSLNILSGINDVGKSNVLKALNLFFNNETVYLASLQTTQNDMLLRNTRERKIIL